MSTTWNHSIQWVGDGHILISSTNAEKTNEILLTVKEYVQMMQLLQKFNNHFKNKIDDKLIEGYLNE
jgi:hypothetical protein